MVSYITCKEDYFMNFKALISNKDLILYRDTIRLLEDTRANLYSANIIEQFSLLQIMYRKVKEFAISTYESGSFSKYYPKINKMLVQCDSIFKGLNYSYDTDKYIVDNFIDVYSIDTLLDFIVTTIRNRIINEYKTYAKDNLNVDIDSITIDQIDLTNMCEDVSKYVEKECKIFGIKCQRIKIDPAFDKSGELFNGSGYHYFNILEYQNKTYIMDLSYSQFFKQDAYNMLSRLGVPYTLLCNPGIYMLSDKDRSKVAKDILKRGWVPFTDENFKMYLDGFTLSFRNGLYYELLGKVDYSTNYDFDDYYNFLTGKDSLYRYEPKEGLGVQERPLKDPHINFNCK